MPAAVAPAHYEIIADAGASAPWLTLVHGLSQHRGLFSAQIAAFRADFRLLLIDLPGHGLSAALPGPYGLAEYAGSVAGALEAAGVSRTHYWGSHTGAGVGLLLACERPGRLRSLVLEGPVLPGQPPPSVTEMMGRVTAIARGQGMEAARRHWWEGSGWFAAMRERPSTCRAEAHRALLAEFGGAPWLDATPPKAVAPIRARLPGLSLPVLIVNGAADLPDFLAVAELLAALIPGARRAVIPDGGGFPLWEVPTAVNAAVRPFLAAAADAGG